ncbi:MAG: DNA polymerase I [Anaerolineae bacterium]|nr:DNA polymerase I [Anaerolineae bacterium]MDW8172826.1 DNA polymerase I [Anaerolineae bacterium]
MPLLTLIDGHAFAYRQFYAMQSVMRGGGRMATRSGEPTYAVYRFADELLRLLTEKRSDYLAVAFDRGLSGRDALYPGYKAQRADTPEELIPQLARIEALVCAFNIPILAVDGYEADDMIGAIVSQAEAQGVNVLIISGDRDLLQLISPLTRVQLPNFGKGGDDIIYDEAVFVEKYKFRPDQLVDFKALKGDSSDNIPGVAGIGDKGATDLLLKYGTLDGIYAHLHEIKDALRQKLIAGRDMAYLSRRLATIQRDAPINLDLAACVAHDFDPQAVDALFAELEFRSLRQRLRAYLRQEDNQEVAEPSSGQVTESQAEVAPSQPQPLDYETIIVRDEATLVALVARLESATQIVFDTETTGVDPMRADLVGIALAVDERTGYYIPVGHLAVGSGTLFPEQAVQQLSLQRVLEALRPALTAQHIPKIAHNATYDLLVLRRHGLDVSPISFDTMIAEWVRDPISRFLGLKNFALQELQIVMQNIEELIGKGAKARTMAEVAVEDAAPYASADAVVTWRAARFLSHELDRLGQRQLYETLELPLIPIIAQMEQDGALLDVPYLQQVGRQMSAELQALEARIMDMAGQSFNVNSTQQLSKVLFDHLKLPTRGLKKTGTGSISTDSATLDALRDQHPIIPVIIEHRELSKLKNTYVDALPSLIHPKTGRVHTSYNQTGTSTGRFSSSNPNLQNIPIRTERGREVRRAFISPPGCLLIAVDYSQVELRIMAHMSGSRTLQEAFAQGQDIHKATAAAVFGVPLSQVSAEQRAFAKKVNFGLMYGMGAYRLTRDSELTMAESKAFIERYFERLPEVKAYMDATEKQAKTQGYVETLFGRRRYFRALAEGRASAQEAQAELRAAINAPIQGTAADMLKQAMIRLASELRAYPQARLILQVHDELVLEAPEDQAVDVARLTVQVMQAVQLPQGQPWRVPIVANAELGPNWLDMQPLAK